jgi:hypothetical protein
MELREAVFTLVLLSLCIDYCVSYGSLKIFAHFFWPNFQGHVMTVMIISIRAIIVQKINFPAIEARFVTHTHDDDHITALFAGLRGRNDICLPVISEQLM